MKDVNSYLKKMTDIAREYDIIVAGDLLTMPYDFDPSFKAPKLYWDSNGREYVFADENGVRRPNV